MAANPYGGLVSSLDSGGFEALCAAVAERKCRALIGAGTLGEAAELWRPSPPCPACGFPDCSRDGKTLAGRQRWRCPKCGEAFSALTGTVLESSNKELPVWERFITCTCYNAPIDLAVEVCGIAHTTAFEWRHRVFATVDGYQDRLVLRGRVWIDELYLTDSDIVRSAEYVPKRGLSKNKICIAVAIDAFKNAVVVQGGCEGPCVPGGDGAREQPVLVAQALPLPLPRDEEGQPPVLPELVRVPVPRPPRRGEVAQNGKGHAPFAHDRCALSQLKVGIGPARFATLGSEKKGAALTSCTLQNERQELSEHLLFGP